MVSLIVAIALISFVTQLLMLYSNYTQQKPRIVLVTEVLYAILWASLATVETFDIDVPLPAVVALLAVLIPLSVLSFRSNLRTVRKQSA